MNNFGTFSNGSQRNYFNPASVASASTNNIIWVQGIEGAKAWQLAPNSMIILLDNEAEGKMYIKVSDNIGMSSLRCFNYVEEVQTAQDGNKGLDLSMYVKKDELQNLIKEIMNEQLISTTHVPNPKIIPETWYKYTRQQVDASTRKTAIQSGFEKWVDWETETKVLYENMYDQLIELNEVAAASELKCFIIDVDKELSKACQKYLELKIIDFDISNIYEEQEELYKKYKAKIKCRD